MSSLRVMRILWMVLAAPLAVGPTTVNAAPSAAELPSVQDPFEDEAFEDEASADEAPEKRARSKRAKSKRTRSKSRARWVKHKIVPNERLDQIAKRYGVSREAIIRWNKSLQSNGGRLYAGRTLRIYARRTPPARKRTTYKVQFGDTWAGIAKRYNVEASDLQRWNPRVPKAFRAGTRLTIYTNPKKLEQPEPEDAPEDAPETDDASADGTELARAEVLTRDGAGETSEHTSTAAGEVAEGEPSQADQEMLQNFLAFSVRPGGASVGKPNRGRLLNGVQLPQSDLYTIRNPDDAWGSSHAILQIQSAIAKFRAESGYEGELLIGAISKRSGGRFRPHKSHQSGRDIDIRLPKKAWAPKDSASPKVIDWRATWFLVKAFIETNEIEYIFLDYGRQRYLMQAAKAAGASPEEIQQVFQFPRGRGKNHGWVRHSPGHDMHIHVRIKCGAAAERCESY